MNEAPPNIPYTALSRTMRFPSLVKELADFFRSRSGEAYLVGGAVRDALLGHEPEDIDLAVSEDAYTVACSIADTLGGHCFRLHEDPQIARAVLSGGEWSGNVDIVTIQDGIEQDMLRRDFTVNAMALPIDAASSVDIDAHILDGCGGLADLRSGIIRMVSIGALDEDCVRLMRGARLAVQFGFSLESETASAISARSSLIMNASQERVRDELMRILRMPDARAGVRLLDGLGLLCRILPELAEAKGITQPKEHYWDVFDHLVEAVGWVDAMFHDDADESVLSMMPRFEGLSDYYGGEVGVGFDRLTYLKLAALLHDIAKPATKTIEASGRIRFLGHHTEGAVIAREIMKRLRFNRRGVDHVAGMVRHHLRPRQMAEKGKLPTKRALYRYYRDVGDVALDTLYLNTADYLAARGPMLEQEDWERHCDLIRHILEAGNATGSRNSRDSVKSLPKLVSGYDIIDRFALAPGRTIGVLLEEVKEAQASGEVSTREQALELVRTSLERGGNGA